MANDDSKRGDVSIKLHIAGTINPATGKVTVNSVHPKERCPTSCAGRQPLGARGSSSSGTGAASDAYRSGWDATFGRGRPAAIEVAELDDEQAPELPRSVN